MQASEIRTKTAGMMPGLLVDLERLVVHLGTMQLFDGGSRRGQSS
jgi:hypothetical protein